MVQDPKPSNIQLLDGAALINGKKHNLLTLPSSLSECFYYCLFVIFY